MAQLQSFEETSLVRQMALELLEQAFRTDSSQTLSRERANRLEALLARHLNRRYVSRVVELALGLSLDTWTGRSSLHLNGVLRGQLLPVDLIWWKPEQLFPELELNQNLSQEERLDCQTRVDRERQALTRAFHWALAQQLIEPRFFGLDDALYWNFYEQVCLEEGATTVKRPSQQQLVEWGPSGVEVFQLEIGELLRSAVQGVNPITQRAYSLETLRRIRGRFQIELKLLEFSLQLKD